MSYSPEWVKELRERRGSQAGANAGWSTGTDVRSMLADKCTYSDKRAGDHVINFAPEVSQAVRWLMANKNVEWQMLLRGRVTPTAEGDVVTADSYYIPKQVVTGATVKNVDCIDKQFIVENEIVATLHSHVSMGAFFSQTDKTECNSSPIVYHVVMNNKFEYQAVKQVKLPCGMLAFQECEVRMHEDVGSEPGGVTNIGR